jgi:hypothetical protein
MAATIIVVPMYLILSLVLIHYFICIANINIHKLDSAFDIDPLFHKMSKTFDEGGAKGLLLANLGVGTNGCNIVFDSTLDDEQQQRGNDEEEDIVAPGSPTSVTVDVTSLTSKLDSLLGGQPIHSLQLVPQLASLREEFAQLQHDGFVEHVTRVRYITITIIVGPNVESLFSFANIYLFPNPIPVGTLCASSRRRERSRPFHSSGGSRTKPSFPSGSWWTIVHG